MLTLQDPREVLRVCDGHRREDRRIGLVPTMGYLHEGHLSLVRRAKQIADVVAVSIFVNPIQFGPNEDLSRYPRDLDSDLSLCRGEGVDLLFAPEPAQMYPEGFQTLVEVEGLSKGLCGDRRPGHFKGVTTVVAKLMNIVGPCVALFGEKDYQQLQIIRRMVFDLNLPVEVVGCPIVREVDGLAMSSRNAYLTVEERRVASCLFRALQRVRAEIPRGNTLPAEQAIALARDVIEREPGTRIDYIEVRDAASLRPGQLLGNDRAVLALAVFVGRTRLIDNMVL